MLIHEIHIYMDEKASWYKDAIIYELHVRCFYDSNDDGIGDFLGMTEKLGYLQDLGVTAIWLLPFYPSPLKDDGYDIADYTDIHESYGNLRDFKLFLKEAHRRGLKVITEVVVNHTSDQHPWFQRARTAKPGSRYRDYYVWSETPEKYKEARIIFQDFETSNWTWDPVAKSYYWHRFYSHQPDLNFDNPDVHQAIFRIVSFWLKLGVDGIRLDAVPYLYEREKTLCENLPETHDFLKELRHYVDSHFDNRMLLAEANQWPEDAAKYFGEGDECHMAFHFPVMPRLFMAIHLEDSLPIVEIHGQTPTIPDNCQWALFLRNHDELTLEMVTDEERDYMFRVYAHDPQARLNLGIRRRLAPLLKNDRRKIELMNSLLFSLTGTPVLYYGDEIGMGDNIYLGDRNGVRTPMQWSSDRNAGFSRTNPQRLYLPPIIDPEYHFETVNVEAQQNNPYSLLWWTKQLISLRKRFKAFGHGTTHFIVPKNRKTLVFFREYQDELILIIANLSRFPQYVELDLSKYNGFKLIELFSGEYFPPIGELPYFLTLGPYGYYWFALEKEREIDYSELRRDTAKRILTLTVHEDTDVEKIFHLRLRENLNSLIQTYLFKRDKCPHSVLTIDETKTKLLDHFALPSEEFGKIHLLVLLLVLNSGVREKYPCYLVRFHGERARKAMQESPETVVVQFQTSKEHKLDDVLVDVSETDEMKKVISNIIHRQRRIKGEKGQLSGISLLKKTSEQTTALELYELLEEGLDIDIEMRSSLSTNTPFKHFLPLLGYVDYPEVSSALAKETISIPNELKAKELGTNHAEHYLERMRASNHLVTDEMLNPSCTLLELSQGTLPPEFHKTLETSIEVARQLGGMTAEFHQAMASRKDLPNFAPTPFTLFYQRSLYQNMRRKVIEACSHLQEIYKNIVKELQVNVDLVQQNQEPLFKWIHLLLRHKFHAGRSRYHGDYTLDHLLYSGKEFLISNFEGSPFHSYYERKHKRSPLIDVASMLYSFVETSFTTILRQHARGMMTDIPLATLNRWAMGWAIWVGSSFVRSYLRQAKSLHFLPKNPKEIDFLIGLFLIEKSMEKIVEKRRAGSLKVVVPLTILSHWLPIYVKTKAF